MAFTAGAFVGGTACNGQTAITPATWNATTLAGDDITWICPDFQGAHAATGGATLLTFHDGGTSGHPVVLNFDTGTVLDAPWWGASNGAINGNGKSFIVVDGKGTGSVSLGTFAANGIVENTANGDSLANRQISRLMTMLSCNTCTVKNLVLANNYVAVQDISTLGGAMTQMNALAPSGPNWTITNNVIHDCGWCLYWSYAAGDTNEQVFGNEFYNWDHAFMFAASSAVACTAPCLFFHDNKVHDNVNFQTPTCIYHLDGIHFFGVGVSRNTMDGIYVYNNYWYGTLSGPCSSGFIFAEKDNSTSGANIRSSFFWNNVFDASGATTVGGSGNPNGWFGLFSSDTQAVVVSNTLIFKDVLDGTNGFNVGSVTSPTFENNVSQGVNMGNNMGTLTGSPLINFNFYNGPACHLSNNCFIFNGAFKSTFAAWKTACACDANSNGTTSDAAAKMNADGSLQVASPMIAAGTNLSSLATGNLVSLQNDTTLGGSRTPNARPGVASWDVGAWCSAATCAVGPPPPPAPAVNML